jgi:hypothetical protein
MTRGPQQRPAAERFWTKVRKTPTCWIWEGCRNKLGYGLFYVSPGKKAKAHRFAYETLVGPIPEGKELDHVKARGCVGPQCVNPAHLEPVTHRENLMRADSVTARAARAIHCPQGHPYDAANTYHAPQGGRRCRECARQSSAVARAKRTPEQQAAMRQYLRDYHRRKKAGDEVGYRMAFTEAA